MRTEEEQQRIHDRVHWVLMAFVEVYIVHKYLQGAEGFTLGIVLALPCIALGMWLLTMILKKILKKLRP